jgi:3-oxoacyl-[acyl-carrier protein] reductase
LVADREDLRQALNRVAIVASDKYRGVRLMASADGCRVVIASRSDERIGAAADRLRASTGGEVVAVAVDVTEPDGPAGVVKAARDAFGEPEIVVTNAGGPPAMPAVDATAVDLVAATGRLLLPVQRFLWHCLPAMRRAGWGRLVAITSIAVREPQPGLVLSNALRAGLTGYLKSVADEVAADGVTVNSVLPGYTATDRLGELAATKAAAADMTIDEVMSGWTAATPLGRLLEPAEVAAAVAFLASDAASGITGHALPVDGGLGRGLL